MEILRFYLVSGVLAHCFEKERVSVTAIFVFFRLRRLLYRRSYRLVRSLLLLGYRLQSLLTFRVLLRFIFLAFFDFIFVFLLRRPDIGGL